MGELKPEKEHLDVTTLFGRAINTGYQWLLERENTARQEPAFFWAGQIVDQLCDERPQFRALPINRLNYAENILAAGIYDTRRIVRPFLPKYDRQKSERITHDSRTIETLARLAQSDAQHLNIAIRLNRMEDEDDLYTLKDTSIVSTEHYVAQGEGCPFAGRPSTPEDFGSEPRPLFKKFAHWATGLALAELDADGHFVNQL